MRRIYIVIGLALVGLAFYLGTRTGRSAEDYQHTIDSLNRAFTESTHREMLSQYRIDSIARQVKLRDTHIALIEGRLKERETKTIPQIHKYYEKIIARYRFATLNALDSFLVATYPDSLTVSKRQSDQGLNDTTASLERTGNRDRLDQVKAMRQFKPGVLVSNIRSEGTGSGTRNDDREFESRTHRVQNGYGASPSSRDSGASGEDNDLKQGDHKIKAPDTISRSRRCSGCGVNYSPLELIRRASRQTYRYLAVEEGNSFHPHPLEVRLPERPHRTIPSLDPVSHFEQVLFSPVPLSDPLKL